MSEEDQGELDLNLCRKATDALREHFDTVQIFVTRHEGTDGTVNVAFGSGNWFARKGQVSEWLEKEDEATREMTRARLKEDGDK